MGTSASTSQGLGLRRAHHPPYHPIDSSSYHLHNLKLCAPPPGDFRTTLEVLHPILSRYGYDDPHTDSPFFLTFPQSQAMGEVAQAGAAGGQRGEHGGGGRGARVIGRCDLVLRRMSMDGTC